MNVLSSLYCFVLMCNFYYWNQLHTHLVFIFEQESGGVWDQYFNTGNGRNVQWIIKNVLVFLMKNILLFLNCLYKTNNKFDIQMPAYHYVTHVLNIIALQLLVWTKTRKLKSFKNTGKQKRQTWKTREMASENGLI